MKTGSKPAIALTALLLAGCGVDPVQQDQPIYLQPGQGMMAVVMDTLDPITHVIIEPEDSAGAKINIPSVPAGMNVYLYPVPAGSYCFTEFQYANLHFKSVKEHETCFLVKAGELGYSGNLAPRVEGGRVYSHQNMYLEGFRTLMQQRYPIIAKQFLSPPPRQPRHPGRHHH